MRERDVFLCLGQTIRTIYMSAREREAWRAAHECDGILEEEPQAIQAFFAAKLAGSYFLVLSTFYVLFVQNFSEFF